MSCTFVCIYWTGNLWKAEAVCHPFFFFLIFYYLPIPRFEQVHGTNRCPIIICWNSSSLSCLTFTWIAPFVIVKVMSATYREPRIYSSIHSRFQGLCMPKTEGRITEKLQPPRARRPSKIKVLLMKQYSQMPQTSHRSPRGSQECPSTCPIINCRVNSAGQGVYSECDLCSSQRPKLTLWFRTFFPIKMLIYLHTQNLLLISRNF